MSAAAHTARVDIATLSSRTGVKARTIRSYVSRGILQPDRNHAGHFIFSDSDVERLQPRAALMAQRASHGLPLACAMSALGAEDQARISSETAALAAENPPADSRSLIDRLLNMARVAETWPARTRRAAEVQLNSRLAAAIFQLPEADRLHAVRAIAIADVEQKAREQMRRDPEGAFRALGLSLKG